MSSLLHHRSDAIAVVLLALIWMLFFWRLFTPFNSDQVSFTQGDFSAQFVTFGAYQYARFAEGEIPLWNPYNNGGFPFIADTQSAVFYPPRLMTIGLSILSDEWTYNALQMEAVAHILFYTFLMYLFVRRLTLHSRGSVYGAFAAAVIAGYSGFITGYPPLQLALLEAAIWLPLSLLGVLEATRNTVFRWPWILVSGIALGLAWMAGHPQTALFSTYLIVAYLGYRIYMQKMHWADFIGGLLLLAVVSFGITAVTLIPGIEYLLLTGRADLGFADKGNGFPFVDLIQFILPHVVSLFSPIYIGVAGLVLVAASLRSSIKEKWFWLTVLIISLLLSFGAHTALYHALYNFAPGLRFFRGQERAAFLVMTSLAVLAGSGLNYLASNPSQGTLIAIRRFVLILTLLLAGIALVAFTLHVTELGTAFTLANTAIFSALILISVYAALFRLSKSVVMQMRWIALIAAILVFELLSVNMDRPANFDPVPAQQQISIYPTPAALAVQTSEGEQPYRVDGYRGLQGNFGSLYRVMDIRGISPLFLNSADRIINRNYISNSLAWELFAVRYIFGDEAPYSIPVETLGEYTDLTGPVWLYEILDPRPYAHLIYRADVVDSQEFALALTKDPSYRHREAIVLETEPGIDLTGEIQDSGSATIISFEPESLEINVITPENAILSLSQVHYPGWRATINDQEVPILRAYSALSAIAVPAGEHTITLWYEPRLFQIGAFVSIITWVTVICAGIFFIVKGRRADT